ncbi:MAG TPA: MlaD family protein [Solirubrobacteraceae bacterium]
MRRNQKRRMSHFQAGALVVVLLSIGTYFGFTKSVPFLHHYTVHAVFRSANNIRKNSFVRIAGVNVGKVTGVHHIGGGGQAAVVDMRIDKRGLPLHTDATVAVRPRIFLEGNFFIDVQPGSPSAPQIHDGDTIPINQTRAPVQLDQILTTLQSATRADLQILLKELNKGLSGAGAAGYNASIPYWEPAYKNSAIVNQATLGTAQHDLSGYIKSSGTVAAALDRYPAQLQSLITDFNTTANAFAVRQSQLSAAIHELPRTLAAGIPALDALNNAFPPLRNLVAALRPAVRSSGPAIDASLPLVRQLRGLISASELRGLSHDLRPTVPSLAKLNNETVPLYQQVRAASSCQNAVILPWSHDKVSDATFPAVGPVFQESTKPLVGLAGESRSGDANGQWFKVLLEGGNYATPMGFNQFLLTNNPPEGTNPPKPTARPPLNETAPCENQQPPDLRTVPGTPPAATRVNNDSPAAKALAQTGLGQAVTYMKGALKREGLNSLMSVTDKPITAAQVPHLRAAGSFRK